jgi:hypothetical protein
MNMKGTFVIQFSRKKIVSDRLRHEEEAGPIIRNSKEAESTEEESHDVWKRLKSTQKAKITFSSDK